MSQRPLIVSKKRQLRELIGHQYYKNLIKDKATYKFNNTLNNMERGQPLSTVEEGLQYIADDQVQGISKNQMARDAKKMKKKVAQALAVIIKAEQRPLEEIVTKKGEALTERFLVAHFGNGDEDDQNLIRGYLSQFGEIKRITIFPGISYGYVEYESPEAAIKMMKDLDQDNIKVLTQDKKERHLAILNTVLQD